MAYEGIIVGGPKHGQWWSSHTRRIGIPAPNTKGDFGADWWVWTEMLPDGGPKALWLPEPFIRERTRNVDEYTITVQERAEFDDLRRQVLDARTLLAIFRGGGEGAGEISSAAPIEKQIDDVVARERFNAKRRLEEIQDALDAVGIFHGGDFAEVGETLDQVATRIAAAIQGSNFPSTRDRQQHRRTIETIAAALDENGHGESVISDDLDETAQRFAGEIRARARGMVPAAEHPHFHFDRAIAELERYDASMRESAEQYWARGGREGRSMATSMRASIYTVSAIRDMLRKFIGE